MEHLKIGVVIADDDEYKPFLKSLKDYKTENYNFYKRPGVSFFEGSTEVVAVYSGVGKVNAAVAATHLIETAKCDILLNFGLSGGISGVKRGQTVINNEFLEHDFDLTVIGYKPCEKPLQDYIYKFDGKLYDIAKNTFENIKTGTAVSGDCFICDDKTRNLLKESFGAISCDMETAAIAYVCKISDKPFLALRRISDDAGDDAYANYSEMNINEGDVLTDMFMKFIKNICKEYKK